MMIRITAGVLNFIFASSAGRENSGSEEEEKKGLSPQNGETSCSFQMPSVRARFAILACSVS